MEARLPSPNPNTNPNPNPDPSPNPNPNQDDVAPWKLDSEPLDNIERVVSG